MQVGYELRESTIKGAGFGVFTTEDIRQGKMIWKFFDSDHIFYKNADEILAVINKLKTFEEKQDYLVHCYSLDDRVCYELDDGHCMNHSEKPNCGYDVKRDGKRLNAYALRDIKKGEEILVSYDVDQFLNFPPWFEELAQQYNMLTSTEAFKNQKSENTKYLLTAKL